jgi:putative ABC transport system permease protein
MAVVTWPGLVWKNLRRRLARTLMTAAGVALGVALIVALLSIAAGVRQTANDLIHFGRADFGLFQEGAADLTRSLLPASLERRIASTPGVAAVAKIGLHVGKVQGRSSLLVFGYEPGEFPWRRLVIVAGRRARGREAMLGDRAAGSLHLHPGATLTVDGRRYPLAGVYHSGDRYVDIGAVLPLRAFQALVQRPGEVTTFGVAVQPGSRPKDVAKRLEQRLPGTAAVVEPGQAVKVDTSVQLIVDAGWIFSLLALIVGGIGVTNTMAMSVFERVREIGILRAVGWPASRIALLILSEALGIGVIALGIGLAGGYLAAELFVGSGGLSQLTQPDFTPDVFAWGLAFALGVGVLGALYPAWRAVRLTPIAALRQE